MLKVQRRDAIVPQGKTTSVICWAHAGQDTESLTAIFEPDAAAQWPEGLDIKKHFVKIPKGSSCQRNIPMSTHQNMTSF